MHLKREQIPRSWPIPRKKNSYIARPNFEFERGMPLVVILRDVLKTASNKKEVKKAIQEKNILINTRLVKDFKHPMILFDTLSIIKAKKDYRMELNKNGKFIFKEIRGDESAKKISKIINKKRLKGKKLQLNMFDGKNCLVDEKENYKTNDSVVINLKNGKIEKILPLKEKAKVVIFDGKHAGEFGNILKVEENKKTALIDIEKEKVSILIKQLIVVE